MPQFKRGARRSSTASIEAAAKFIPVRMAVPQIAYVPTQLSVWDNSQYGDCVTAEEAFKCACEIPEIFIQDQEVIRWARAHGVLDGAMLDEVLDAMARDGFKQGDHEYRDGGKQVVDYTNADTLRAAIAHGPVKIAIDADALPSSAGNKQGWYAVGGRPGQYQNTDHCVSVCGQGAAQWLYQQLGQPMPSALRPDQSGFLLFTWATIGFVDHEWILSTCVEAWLRQPNTIMIPPEPQPPPPPPPPPAPTPSFWQTLWALIVQYGPTILAWIISILQMIHRDLLTQQARRGLRGADSGSADTPTSGPS